MFEKKSSARYAALLCLAVALLAGSPLAAAELSQADRDVAAKSLTETQQKLHAAIAGLSDAQWTYKSAPDRWSVADVVEHLALTETMLRSILTDQIVKAPPAATPAAKKVADARIFEVITNRSNKAQAPEQVRPSGRWSTRDEVIKAFDETRGQTLEYVQTTKEDLRSHTTPHAAFQAHIDGIQWILFISAHSARHTAQIDEVKADPGFPKS